MLYHPYEYRKPPKGDGKCKPVPSGCKQENVLLPKIIASERRNIPCLCTELALEDIPCCATPPFQLVDLHQSGAQPWWRPVDQPCDHRRNYLKIFIPVCAEMRDNCGKCWHATGVVETEVSVGSGCSPCDSWKQQLFLIPCVRLLPGCQKSDNGVFCVKVDIQLEIYLLRPEPCCVKRGDKQEKPCPDLPMYPQMPSPCHDRWDDGCPWKRWES